MMLIGCVLWHINPCGFLMPNFVCLFVQSAGAVEYTNCFSAEG